LLTATLSGLEISRRRSVLYQLSQFVNSHKSIGSGNCKVVVVSSTSDWDKIAPDVLSHVKLFPFIGLDCEWVSMGGTPAPVSLLQIATHRGLCVLVRLSQLESFPQSLRQLLVDYDVIKAGVAILDDAKKLLVDYNIDLNGCVDLRHLVVRYTDHSERLGLDNLASTFLGVTLDKDWRLRAGEWDAEELSDRQIEYAANDALVAVNILVMVLKPQVASGWLKELSLIRLSQKNLINTYRDLVFPYVDLRFKNISKAKSISLNDQKSRSSSPKISTSRAGNSVRKSPLYHNVKLEAPDGQILCTCDYKKAMWYVTKEIGIVVCEDPLTVRLNFEPSGRPEGKAGEYYLSVKPNICVVCGKEESYLRKSVVPHEYRRYFPTVMKDHQSHDVLLMCMRCHQSSNMHDVSMRRELGSECNAPIGTDNDVKVCEDRERKRVRSAGRALRSHRRVKSKANIPQDRLEELEKVLLEYYDVEEVDDELVEAAAECSWLSENEGYVPHSRAVVQYFLENGGLIQLEVRWRQHFLKTMLPKFLPPLWSVNHQKERLDVKAAENRIDMEQYKLATGGLDKDQQIDLEAYRSATHVQLGINPEDFVHIGIEEAFGEENKTKDVIVKDFIEERDKKRRKRREKREQKYNKDSITEDDSHAIVKDFIEDLIEDIEE